MIEYYPGYIFHDGDDYPEIAAWCNANGCYIKEITPDAQGRRFEIVKIPPRSLDEAKADKITEINAEKNNLLNNGNVKFKDDVFDIDDTSLLRISGTIQDWKDQIDNGLDESGIIQKWISQTNTVHDLTYSELIELARNMRLRVQSIVFYANVLKAHVSQCSTLEEVDNIKWTFE